MKRCGTCRWFLPVVEVYDSDDKEARVAGSCDWAEHVHFPHSMRFVRQGKVGVYADEGENCPCHLQCGAETFKKAGFQKTSNQNGSLWIRLVERTNYIITISNSEGNSAELNYHGDYWVVAIHLEDKVVLESAETPEKAVILADEFEAAVSRIH